jgi:hypothetical protein
VHGAIPPTDFNGLKVWGSNGNAWLLQSIAVVASSGPGSDTNPVGVRKHINPAYQGLRHIPGLGPYPLVDSFYARGFGVGVRHRSAAAVCQITTASTDTPPTIAT